MTLVGMYIPSLLIKLSKLSSRYRNDIKNIDVDIIEIITKSTTHAKNLSFHLARIIFDELSLSVLLNILYLIYLVKYVNYYNIMTIF